MNRYQFLLGVVLGTIISSVIHLMWFRPGPHFGGPPPFGSERMEKHFVNHFARELDLSPEQLKSVEPILQRLHLRLLEIRFSNDKQVEKIMKDTDNELLPLLSADQQERLASMRERFENERRREKEFLATHQAKSAE